MHRTPRRKAGLLALGAAGLMIGLAGCNQPAASPSPTAMMEESPTHDTMMKESPTPDAMMKESPTPDAMMEESPSPQ